MGSEMCIRDSSTAHKLPAEHEWCCRYVCGYASLCVCANHRVKLEFSLSYPSMQSFVDNFEGINHTGRYFNRKQYRYLHLIPRTLNQFLNRVNALCLPCGANMCFLPWSPSQSLFLAEHPPSCSFLALFGCLMSARVCKKWPSQIITKLHTNCLRKS